MPPHVADNTPRPSKVARTHNGTTPSVAAGALFQQQLNGQTQSFLNQALNLGVLLPSPSDYFHFKPFEQNWYDFSITGVNPPAVPGAHPYTAGGLPANPSFGYSLVGAGTLPTVPIVAIAPLGPITNAGVASGDKEPASMEIAEAISGRAGFGDVGADESAFFSIDVPEFGNW